MAMTRVVVAAIPKVEGAPLDFESPLVQAGCEVIDLGPQSRKGDPELAEALKAAEILIPGNLFQVDGEVLDHAPVLKLIAKPGAGLDNIDLSAATERGVPVCHTPGVNAQSVADHTWALILNLTRGISLMDPSVRRGSWKKTAGTEAWRKTIGIVGMGAIGRAVAARARGFDMRILGHDPFWPTDPSLTQGVKRVDLEELLREADIVTIHCPLTDGTRGLIGADRLSSMKPTAILINTARGHIVDEEALADALSRGVIAGAGLDAFAREPLSSDSPLIRLPNVILTPHAAWLSREALEKTVAETVAAVVAVTRGKRPKHIANPAVYGRIEEEK